MRVGSQWFRLLGVLGAWTMGCAPGALRDDPGVGSPPSAVVLPRPGAPAYVGVPLVLDRGDLGFGTTVQFDRIPTLGELNDLQYVSGLARVVLTLDAWPGQLEALRPLEQRMVELDVVVVLAGYPPTREAVQAWNQVPPPLRLVVVVDGPPADRGVIHDLNALRSLERIIVQTDSPSRAGFERLQRPLSFRRIVR